MGSGFEKSNFIYHMSYHSIYISNKIDGSAGAAGRSGAFRKGGSLNGWRFRTYLYSKNGSEALANASTTKILTCIIALENCDLEQITEVSVQAAKAPKVHLGAPAGQKFRMKDLIYAMMLESFNDCAVVIAEQVAGTTEHFSKLMNDYAKRSV